MTEFKQKAIDFIRKIKHTPTDRSDNQVELFYEEELDLMIGFAKELQEELEKWKAEWQEQVQKAIDEGYARTLLQIENGKLKEQIEKMKQDTEWHYPSKGEYPKDEFTDEYTKPRLPSAYKQFYCLCLGDDYLMGKYMRGLFHTVEGQYSLNEIIAWKEIVLPKESE